MSSRFTGLNLVRSRVKGHSAVIDRFDVGGYYLAACVTAGNDPPVVFVSGRGDDHTVWAQVIAMLRAVTATVSYDRAAIGDSDPVPVGTARPHSALAAELVALLDRLPLTGPFVVVGHSLGAVIARSLAARYPALVAGLVLVDGSVDEVTLWPGITSFDGKGPQATLLDYPAGAAELAAAQYPDVPAVVITRTPGRPWPGAPSPEAIDERWTRHQQSMADRLNAVLLVANNSGHYVHVEAPNLVALAVDAVVEAVRAAHRGLRALDASQVAAAGGTLARA